MTSLHEDFIFPAKQNMEFSNHGREVFMRELHEEAFLDREFCSKVLKKALLFLLLGWKYEQENVSKHIMFGNENCSKLNRKSQRLNKNCHLETRSFRVFALIFLLLFKAMYGLMQPSMSFFVLFLSCMAFYDWIWTCAVKNHLSDVYVTDKWYYQMNVF